MPRLAGPHPAHALRLAADRKAAGPETAAAGSAGSPATRTLAAVGRRLAGVDGHVERSVILRGRSGLTSTTAGTEPEAIAWSVRTSTRPAPVGYAAGEPTGSPAISAIRRKSRVGSSVAMITTGARARQRGNSARADHIARAGGNRTKRTDSAARERRAILTTTLTNRTESHRAASVGRTGANRAKCAGGTDRTNRLTRGGTELADRKTYAPGVGRTVAARRSRTENHRAASVGHHGTHPTRRRTSDRPVGSRRERPEPQTAEIHTRELDGERAGHLLDPRGWSNVLRCSPLGH
jgi:hypothetical protein